MSPIRDILKETSQEYLWYIPNKLLDTFPFKTDPFTTSILDLTFFKSDIIFVPGNEVPYYIRGLKVQIFHGLAGEKKGHFRIRQYFDLYLTQGPYFTRTFKELKAVHENFDVIETGWPKLDVYAKQVQEHKTSKQNILEESKADTIVLYAPTFSPKLTSAPFLVEEIKKLATTPGILVFIKFHDLMAQKWESIYQELADTTANIIFKKEKDIVPFLLQADILISDTSSVIYEFLLLDKPVISFDNISKKIQWDNYTSYTDLTQKVLKNLKEDPFKKERNLVNKEYHPYRDGLSAQRMLTASLDYISKNGVPTERKLSIARKLKIHSIFRKPIKDLWNGVKKEKITALLITYNEAKNIDAVLENIKFADQIIVVDSFSTDDTIAKIKKHKNVQLIKRAFTNYTDQKSFALEQADHDWVLFLDADELLTDKLKNEVLKLINAPNTIAVAFKFVRTFMFKQEVLRFSGWQSDKNYKLFRKSKVKFDASKIVHETLIVDGKSAVLKNKLLHYSYNCYESYKGKMVKYGTMRAHEEFEKGKKYFYHELIFRTFYKFFNHYILRLGILDGKMGIIICYLNALSVFTRYKVLKELRKENKITNKNTL